jgi:carboxylesterase type B
VVVEVNYRLGMLGFLSLDSPKVSGNQVSTLVPTAVQRF